MDTRWRAAVMSCAVWLFGVGACGRSGFDIVSQPRPDGAVSPGGDGGGSSTAECGDDRVEAAEACDDGNTAPGDGCSASCALEDQERAADRCPDAVDMTLVPAQGAQWAAMTGGDTTGFEANYVGDCAGALRPDLLVSFTLDSTSDVDVTLTPKNSTFDAAFFAMGLGGYNCGNSTGYFGCTDGAGPGGGELASYPALAPGRYFVVIDSANDSQGDARTGPFELVLVVSPR